MIISTVVYQEWKDGGPQVVVRDSLAHDLNEFIPEVGDGFAVGDIDYEVTKRILEYGSEEVIVKLKRL